MTTDVHAGDPEACRAWLGDHGLRTALVRFVRHRVPGADAEDLVQDTLIDALAASRAPDDPVALRRWVFGIARCKVANRAPQLSRRPFALRDEQGAEPAAGEVDALQLVRWAQDQVRREPDDARTLGWMVREGVLGESLATIAAHAGLAQAWPRTRSVSVSVGFDASCVHAGLRRRACHWSPPWCSPSGGDRSPSSERRACAPMG